MFGQLAKLVIHSYLDEARTGAPKETFTLQFNPAAYTRAVEIEFEQQTGSGNTPGPAKFKRFKSQDYTLEFTLDGTGATANALEPRLDVPAKVAEFLRSTGEMDGEIHRPRFLVVTWGTLLVRCVLKSASLNYTLFKPDGTPLRVKVSAVLSESVDEELRVATEDKQSPDLVRAHELRRGETLPLLAHRHYGDAALYARVARFNGLDDFRALVPGRVLRFPPLAQLPPPEAADA